MDSHAQDTLMRHHLLEIPSEVKRASLLGGLTQFIRERCNQFGISYFMFLSSLSLESISAPDIRLNNGFPDSFELPKMDCASLIGDAVIRYCRSMNSPAVWNMDQSGGLKGELIQADKSILSPATALGVQSGICFPFHGVGSEYGLFVVCSNAPYEQSSLAELETHYVMNLLGSAIFDAHCEDKRTRVETVRKSLTKREVECLTWASDGKTAWEVAAILKVSERTVVFHLQNATRKLGAYSRSGALVKSVCYGII